MAKTNGTVYRCDRDGVEEFIADNEQRKTANWYTVKRVNKDGVEMQYLFCASCRSKFVDLITKEDADFNKFMEVD